MKHNQIHRTFTLIESEVLYEDVKDGTEKARCFSVISDDDLQDETTGPLIIRYYYNLFEHDGNGVLLRGYFQCKFHEIEIYLRTKKDLTEDYIELILKQYNSNLITYEIHPMFYTTADSENILTRDRKKNFKRNMMISP